MCVCIHICIYFTDHWDIWRDRPLSYSMNIICVTWFYCRTYNVHTHMCIQILMNIICMTWIYSRILMSMNITCMTFIQKTCHPYNVHTSVARLYSRTYTLHTHMCIHILYEHYMHDMNSQLHTHVYEHYVYDIHTKVISHR